MDKMDMNIYEAYLPAKIWLQDDEEDRLRAESLPLPFPKSGSGVAAPWKPHLQLARSELASLLERKGRKMIFEEPSQTPVKTRLRDNDDELFLPQTKRHENAEAPSQAAAGRPDRRYLYPAQGLPRTAKPINGLPACLVAGLQPSRKFQSPLASSKGWDERPETLRAPPHPPKEIHRGVKSQGGISKPHDERINTTPSKVQRNRQPTSAETFDPVEFALVPSHYGLHKQAESQDLQIHTSLSSELLPLRSASPLGVSRVFTASLSSTATPYEITDPQKEIQKTSNLKDQNFRSLDEGTNLASSEKHNGQRPYSVQKSEQTNTSLPPQIPPLRTMSPFRYSGIFTASLASLDTTSQPPHAGVHPYNRCPITELSSRAEIPSSLDGSNDVAPSEVQRRTSPERSYVGTTSNIPSHHASHKQVRRRNGYKNLKMAYTSYRIPHLAMITPLEFPDFSFDL